MELNEHIRWTTQVEQVGDKVRDKRLRWFGHGWMLEMEKRRIHGCRGEWHAADWCDGGGGKESGWDGGRWSALVMIKGSSWKDKKIEHINGWLLVVIGPCELIYWHIFLITGSHISFFRVQKKGYYLSSSLMVQRVLIEFQCVKVSKTSSGNSLLFIILTLIIISQLSLTQ